MPIVTSIFRIALKSRETIWFLLLFGAVVHIPISLLGVSTQIALFDVILPAVIAWTVWNGKLAMPSRRFGAALALVLSILLFHSIMIYLFKTSLLPAWLVKETAKVMILVIEFALLLVIFRSWNMQTPSRALTSAVFFIAAPLIAVVAAWMLFSEPFFFARTVYSVALCGLLFLLAGNGDWQDSFRQRLQLAAIGFLVVVIAVLSLSKGIAGLALAMAAWILFGNFGKSVTAGRVVWVVATLALVSIGGVMVAKLAGASIEWLQRMDSIERSISVRGSLWALGLDAFLQTFPWGLGIGQYREVVASDLTLAREGHRFAHNTFITLLAELGFIGLCFSIGLVILLVYAMKGWPRIVQPLFAIFVALPLILHDGHSIRMLMIVVAYGVTRYWSGSGELEDTVA